MTVQSIDIKYRWSNSSNFHAITCKFFIWKWVPAVVIEIIKSDSSRDSGSLSIATSMSCVGTPSNTTSLTNVVWVLNRKSICLNITLKPYLEIRRHNLCSIWKISSFLTIAVKLLEVSTVIFCEKKMWGKNLKSNKFVWPCNQAYIILFTVLSRVTSPIWDCSIANVLLAIDWRRWMMEENPFIKKS